MIYKEKLYLRTSPAQTQKVAHDVGCLISLRADSLLCARRFSRIQLGYATLGECYAITSNCFTIIYNRNKST